MFYPYLAGLIDGDGCFYKEHGGRIRIGNLHRGIIKLLHKKFGGSFCKSKTTYKGKILNNFYYWMVCAKEAEFVIEKVMPFLQEKYIEAQYIWPQYNWIEQKNMTEREWHSYIAGFVDAEGSIYVANTDTYKLFVTISNTYEPIIEKIASYYEESVYDRELKSKKIIYKVSFINQKAKRILKDIEPFLIVKKREARYALQFPLGRSGKKLSDKILEKRKQIKNLINKGR
ncbi:MAG: hypothetical protein DRG20_00915 [Deltaproteobacteria bacterium]|nr:MAG: hypothetical protein DRG20_00915 [Deltaproteobacteria bacterium]